MKANKYSKNSVFLLEIILNILLFSVLTIVGLSFFINTHSISNETTVIHQAVNTCNNIVTIFESGDGSNASILNEFPQAICSEKMIFLYYDENFKICTEKEAMYMAKLEITEKDNIYNAKISYTNFDGKEYFSTNASVYNQLTLKDLEVEQ